MAKKQGSSGVRLTQRDKQILSMIDAFDGQMTLAQIHAWFYPKTTIEAPRKRMQSLINAKFLTQGDDASRQRYVPLGEKVYWLTKRGAAVVAGMHGRTLKRGEWRGPSRWSLVEHDIHVNNVRLMVMTACKEHPRLQLDDWITELELKRYKDKVIYRGPGGRKEKKLVNPDGYFQVTCIDEENPERAWVYAYLLEVDMGTESNTRFAREKVPPLTAYINDQVYRERFGRKAGRVLVITRSQKRMENMLKNCNRYQGADHFYFSTFQQVSPETIFTEPVWRKPSSREPFNLIKQLP